MNENTIESRLAKAKTDLEQIKYNQKYNFSSLVARPTILVDGTIPEKDIPANFSVVPLSNIVILRFSLTPKSGRLLPLSVNVRFRRGLGNEDVMASPVYNSDNLFLTLNRLPPDPDTGVYIIECYYYTDTPGLITFFKVITSGFDDYVAILLS